jgi:hypothetical protein
MMTYQLRRGSLGYYVTHSTRTAITRRSCLSFLSIKPKHCITTFHGSPRPSRYRLDQVQRNAGYTQTWHLAFCQATAAVSSPAVSVSIQNLLTPYPHHHHRRQFQPRGAARPFPTSSSRTFSTTSRASCSAIIPSSIMADRDVLPATVKPSHYDLSISSMNFDDWSYQGEVS